MGAKSAIEWTDSTWNPVTGCRKVSPGCMHCYAERMAKRLCAMGQPNYARGFDLSLHEHWLDLPLRWKRPQAIFVNSMSDLFLQGVPEGFIAKVFDVMGRASWHVFQILTKRSARLKKLSPKLPWSQNIWTGVSVESREYVFRISHLRETGAPHKFLSLEPLLGPLSELDMTGIDWVIVGGESGPGARPMRSEWVRDIRDQCISARVPFFFKQWGGTNRKKAGRELDGKTWDEVPVRH
ncbi:MAG: phage Gp37/Gp68 family protein [Thermodesulfobacteriota bacterium]